jgi:hypothetical protein
MPVIPDDPDDRIPRCTRDIDVGSGTCVVELACRRKVDSGQRRCFPLAPGGNDVDYQFRCDGSRPGGTPRPEPTVTLTPSPDPTATNSAATCNNNIIEGDEVCDGTALNGQSCASQGCVSGILSCRVDCQGFNVQLCTGIGAGCGQ